MYSDNGTNFKGASHQLSKLYELQKASEGRERIEQFCRESQITWQFIPPGAPHFGRLREAAVKSAKYHLQGIVYNSHLTFEELQTVLCEIEAILNSHPLSSDPNDIACLTPGYFLIGDVLNRFPCHDLTNINQGRLIRWQRVAPPTLLQSLEPRVFKSVTAAAQMNGQRRTATSRKDDAGQAAGSSIFAVSTWSHKRSARDG